MLWLWMLLSMALTRNSAAMTLGKGGITFSTHFREICIGKWRRTGTGEKVRANKERDGMSLNLNARPHKLGRAHLYLGTPALIC